MSDGAAVAVREQHSTALDFRRATEAASVCKQIVTATAIHIAGRNYVRVEGWQAIAVAHGCVASARDVQRIEGGIRAIGEVRRGSDGMVLSAAEGFVGDDEEAWGKRDEYAKRAMAQTRAISRACRSAFAHVVVLMNAGLETTPAEEVPDGGFQDHPTSSDKPAHQAAPEVHKPGPAANTFSGVIMLGEVKHKDGKSAKGPWTRWYAKDEGGMYYSTFNKDIGDAMENLAHEQVNVLYKVEKGPKGESRTVLNIAPIQVEADTGAGEEAAETHAAAREAAEGAPF